METELKQFMEKILEELKYHSKLLENVYEALDEKHHHQTTMRQDLSKQYQELMGNIFKHPAFAKSPELQNLKDIMIKMGAQK
jgi:glucose-6-phosphate-specific signal transduction histidine kinase